MSIVRIKRGKQLRDAVRPFPFLSASGVIRCASDHGLVIQAMDSAHSFTVTFKAAPDQALTSLYCDGPDDDDDDHGGVEFVSADLNALDDKLRIIRDGDSVSILFGFKHADQSRDSFLVFSVQDTIGNDRRIRLDHMDISYVPVDRQRELDVGAVYDADLVVGMDSGVFQQILGFLDQYEKKVTVSITESRVEFKAGDETVTITKQRDGCIIGGARGENPTILVIHTYYLFSYYLASESSRSTWLLRREDGSALLIFPVWPLGNIMYLFPRPSPISIAEGRA